jgi:hypothetical protein
MPCASLDVGPDGQIGVVWTSAHIDEVPDAYFAESLDGGLSFGANHRTHPDREGMQQLPAVAYDGLGIAHTLWEESAEPSYDFNVYYARTADGGWTFSPPERVNDDPPTQYVAQEKVAAAGLAAGGPLAVWMDSRLNWEDNVFFAGPAPASDAGGRFAATAQLRVIPSVTRGAAELQAHWARIHDLQGRLVRAIGRCGVAGGGRLHWDGCDRFGRRVPPGYYRILLGGPGGAATRGLVVVR